MPVAPHSHLLWLLAFIRSTKKKKKKDKNSTRNDSRGRTSLLKGPILS